MFQLLEAKTGCSGKLVSQEGNMIHYWTFGYMKAQCCNKFVTMTPAWPYILANSKKACYHPNQISECRQNNYLANKPSQSQFGQTHKRQKLDRLPDEATAIFLLMKRFAVAQIFSEK